MSSPQLLPPLPDELVRPGMKDAVIAWLNDTGLPSRTAAWWLQRWGAYVGEPITREDYRRVRRDLPPLEGA